MMRMICVMRAKREKTGGALDKILRLNTQKRLLEVDIHIEATDIRRGSLRVRPNAE